MYTVNCPITSVRTHSLLPSFLPPSLLPSMFGFLGNPCGFVVFVKISQNLVPARILTTRIQGFIQGSGGGGGENPSLTPPEKYDAIITPNIYNSIYNTIEKYGIIIGLMYYSWIWRFFSLNTCMSRITKQNPNGWTHGCTNTRACTHWTHRHFPFPGKILYETLNHSCDPAPSSKLSTYLGTHWRHFVL